MNPSFGGGVYLYSGVLNKAITAVCCSRESWRKRSTAFSSACAPTTDTLAWHDLFGQGYIHSALLDRKCTLHWGSDSWIQPWFPSV